MSKTRWQVLLGALVFYSLDMVSKAMVMQHMALGQTISLIPGVIQLTRTSNTGAAFSLFYQYPMILTAVAALLLALFLMLAFTRRAFDTLDALSFMLVLGGALGNLTDRLRFGSVVDFIDVSLIHYPIFNLADSFVLIGILCFAVQYVRQNPASC